MKIKFIILFFPVFLLGQNSVEIEKMKVIDAEVKRIDSISSFINEEVSNGEILVSHGPQERRRYTNTRVLKHSEKVLRICYLERRWETDNDLSLYYVDSKLIYAELLVWRSKKRKPIKRKYYFENEIAFYPSYSNRKYDLEEEMEILGKSRSLLTQACR